jgi:hypothetical protein
VFRGCDHAFRIGAQDLEGHVLEVGRGADQDGDVIKLGEKVRCTLTGFEGIATKRMDVLHGSSQIHVEGRDNGFRRDEWIEEGRLRIADEKPAAIVTELSQVKPP